MRRDLDHGDKAAALRDGGDIHRIAVHRVVAAGDGVAPPARRFRFGRNAEGGQRHRRASAGAVGDALRRRRLGLRQRDDRPVGRRAVEQEAAGIAAVDQGMGGKQRPGGFLRRQMLSGQPRSDGVRQAVGVDGGRSGLGREGEKGGRIPEPGAVIGAPVLRFLPRRTAGDEPGGLGEHRVGPALVAIGGERGAKLGRRDGCVEGRGLHVGIVAQVADRRRAFAGQHHQRVGVRPAIRVEIRRVVDLVPEVVERVAEGGVGHRVALLAGAAEEVRHIGVKPEIAGVGIPEAEGAVRGLVEENLGNALFHPLADVAVPARAKGRRHVLEVEKGQRPRGDLLGAAIGIGVKRGQKPRRVEPREGAGRQRGAAGAGDKAREGVAVEREGRAVGEIEAALAGGFRVVRLDRNGQRLEQLPAVGRGQRDAEGGVAFLLRRGQRHRDGGLAKLGQIDARGRGAKRQAIGRQVKTHAARRAAGMDDFQQRPAFVAGREEARDRSRHHDRIADQNLGLGLSDRGFRPGDRHHPDGAVEGRHREFGPRIAIGTDRQRAGEIGHQFLGRRRRLHLQPARGIAAGADAARAAVRAVDQAAIDVADSDAELALAEIVILGVRRGEAGQVQDTEIDGGDGGMDRLARLRALDLQGDGQWPARVGLGRDLQRGAQLARSGIDRRIGQAKRAHGRAAGIGSNRADDRGGDIGPRAPVIGHGQIDHGLARLDRHRLHVDQPVRQDRDQSDSVGARLDPDPRGLAGPVGGLVERELKRVGRARRVCWGVPAGIERDRARGVVAIRRLDDQLVIAPVHRRGDRLRPLGGQGEIAGGDAAAGRRHLPVPLAVERIPLVVGLQPVQRPADSTGGGLLVRPDRDHLERGLIALRDHAALEARLDADDRAFGQDRSGGVAFNRAA